MRTSNHELDGRGCQWRQTFTDAAGKVHWDHIYATELFSNYTLRPLHDYVMAQEHVAVAKIRDHLRQVPPRYVVALKTDCLVFQDLPKKFLPELTARKHQDGTPVYRFEECKRLEGEYREPRIEAPYLTCYGPEWRSVEDPLLHCLNGKSLLLSGMPGTGKTHLARQIVAQLCELGEVVKLVSKTHCSVQNLGAGAQTADRFVRRSIRNGSCELDRLVIEEITQLDSSLWADIAELSLNPKVKFLLLGDFRLPAVLDVFGGAPVTKPLQGLPAPPRPGGRLLPRAHGEPPNRRGHLRLPAVPTCGRGGGAAAARGAAAGPGALPEAGAAGHLPGHQPRQQDAPQRAAQPEAGARGGGDAALRGAGRGGHQRPSDDAGLAGAAPRGRGGQGVQGLLRHRGGGGPGRRA